jgi:hypothetical protein
MDGRQKDIEALPGVYERRRADERVEETIHRDVAEESGEERLDLRRHAELSGLLRYAVS